MAHRELYDLRESNARQLARVQAASSSSQATQTLGVGGRAMLTRNGRPPASEGEFESEGDDGRGLGRGANKQLQSLLFPTLFDPDDPAFRVNLAGNASYAAVETRLFELLQASFG